MENEFLTRDSLLALLHHSVLHTSPSSEVEDDEDEPEDDEDESEDESEDYEDASESLPEEPDYYVVSGFGYLSSLANLSAIGMYAYDATQEANAVHADSSMAYEERMQAVAAIERQYRMNTIPYVVELIEHVFGMVDEVDEQAAALFEQMSLLHVLGYAYYSTNGTEARSAVMRTMLTKQLIDAYVLTR